jgi:altronate hydrolase
MMRVINMIVLGEQDNVGVALRDIEQGEVACDAKGREIAAGEAIPQAHKLALLPIGEGEPIIRMGVSVGIARRAIARGALAHVHNVRSQYLDNEEDHYE